MKQSWRRLISLVSRGSRHQFAVALTLITVLPLLVLYYVTFHRVWSDTGPIYHAALLGIVLFVATLGCILLARYPVTIVRLRRYLEQMVSGDMPDKIRLLRTEDDITAIEDYLNSILQQMTRKVENVQGELARLEGLLAKTGAEAGSRRWTVHLPSAPAPHSMAALVGGAVLEGIVDDSLKLIEHAASAYEPDGTCALSILASGWCLATDPAGRNPSEPAPSAPGWHAACRAMATRSAVDEDDAIGLRVYAVPIVAGDSVAGAIAFHYGDPPRDDADIREIADRLGVSIEVLRRERVRYDTRPPAIITVARDRLKVSAQLIGEIIERKHAERVLRQSETELRRHRDHLEELVQSRTRELESTNERLRREMAERERAERLKDDFVGVVSHELRTPLSIVKEGVGILIDRIGGPVTERQDRILGTMRNNVDRLARIISNLLDISRIEAGKIRLEREVVDLAALARQTVTTFEARAKQKGLELKTRFSAESIRVYADGERVLQVLTNLVNNAIKFTDHGSIEIAVTDRPGEVECSVSDTGVGTAEQYHPRLFHKFEQFHRTEGAGERGTGLGLSIAKSIVDLHRGRIWADSRVNEGSRFTFTIPKRELNELAEEAIESRMTAARKDHTGVVVYAVRYDAPGLPAGEEAATRLRQALTRMMRLRRVIRDDDTLLPGAPGEMLIVAPMGRQNARLIVSRIQTELQNSVTTDDGEFRVSATCGLACFPEDGDRPDTLLNLARSNVCPAGGIEVS